MALMPRKVKYRKFQRGKVRGISTSGSRLAFGEYGLKALENGYIANNHIEAARVVVARKTRGVGKLFINIFPHKSTTKKPAEVRMGSGKGDIHKWVAVIKRGKVLFEISGIPEEFAKQIFRLVAFKLPIKTKFVSRSH